MKTLKFEYDGQPLRVYLDRDGAVFVDVKDVAGEGAVKEYLEDHPAARLIDKRPVWTESVFYHAWMDDMAPDRFMFFYLDEVQPRIRETLMCMAEKSWTESKKVRQLEEDLSMNLKARREAEDKAAHSAKVFDFLLDRFVQACTYNGIMSRLLDRINSHIKDEKLRGMITDLLREFNHK
jgi:hypothetical protein